VRTAHASQAILYELDATGELVATVGVPILPDGVVDLAGAKRAMALERPVLLTGREALNPAAPDQRAVLWQPLRQRGHLVGLLQVGWDWPLRSGGTREMETIDLFAAEAAMVLEH